MVSSQPLTIHADKIEIHITIDDPGKLPEEWADVARENVTVRSSESRVLSIIADSGKTGIDKTNLIKATQFVSAEVRNALISSLVESGQVSSIQKPPPNAGRPKTIYFANARDDG